tara:strand:+ start:45 stop:374 length:330 start_codon:yes stop_codon:yes gene_type:complete
MGVSSCLSPALDGSVILDVEIQPAAKTQGITGFNRWRCRISVAVKAEAKRGKANLAVMHVLATELQIAPSSLSITAGHTSRMKSVRVENTSVKELVLLLDSLLGGSNGP